MHLLVYCDVSADFFFFFLNLLYALVSPEKEATADEQAEPHVEVHKSVPEKDSQPAPKAIQKRLIGKKPAKRRSAR